MAGDDNGDNGSANSFYHYNPSMAAACVFTAVFGVSTLLHMWQVIRHRAWYFIPFLIGCIFEALGYVGRAISAHEAPDFTKNPYIIQTILLLLGPALFAASIYMILGRVIVLLDAGHLSMIRPNWLTKVFVIGDVLSFLAQSGGGGMLAAAETLEDLERGENVIVAGLGIQVIFFGVFMIVTLVFHLRIRSKPTPRSHELTVPWNQLFFVLYATSLLIMVRSVFRVAEFVGGTDSDLQRKEWWLYVFDALLMALVAMVFNWFHPSRVISKSATLKRMSSSDGYLMEAQGGAGYVRQDAPQYPGHYPYGYR